jgi:DNA polymerase-3 subunit delta
MGVLFYNIFTMLIMLHGSDSWRSRKQLKKMIEEFKAKRDPSGLNLNIFDASKAEGSEMLEAMVASPFLAEKRLTVLERLSESKKKDLWDNLLELIKNKKLPDTSVIIFWESEIKLNSHPLFETLAKQKFSQKFETLAGVKLNQWIKTEIANRNLEIEPYALTALINYPFDSLWQIINELDKIAAYLSKEPEKKITLKHVNLFLDETGDDNIFHFLDALVARRAKEAIKLLHTQFDNGEEPGKIFNLIVGQWRKLLLIKDYFSLNPDATSDKTAKALEIHPFVVKKTLAILPGFSFAKLKEIYRELLDIDLKTKTGEGDYASSLEMLVAKICQ